jgi:pSer/pThr/pTyr-binding forkhead associated (FHA) protein
VLGVTAPAVDDGSVQVQGIVCSRGHFNDPTSIYCATCGISMVHQTHNLVPGPRPPLGVVVLDDGSVFPLNDDYVLGREPDNSADVQAGRALPLQLDDPDAMVSRVHAKILLQGWDVQIQDANSSNGTFVTRPGESEATRLTADEPVTILPGTRVAMGSRSLVFDSYRKH